MQAEVGEGSSEAMDKEPEAQTKVDSQDNSSDEPVISKAKKWV